MRLVSNLPPPKIITRRPYEGGETFNALVYALADMATRMEKDPSTAHEEAREYMQCLEGTIFISLVFRHLIEVRDTRIWILILLATKTKDPGCMEELISSFVTSGHADLLVRHLVGMNPGVVLTDMTWLHESLLVLVSEAGDLEQARWERHVVKNHSHWLHTAA